MAHRNASRVLVGLTQVGVRPRGKATLHVPLAQAGTRAMAAPPALSVQQKRMRLEARALAQNALAAPGARVGQGSTSMGSACARPVSRAPAARISSTNPGACATNALGTTQRAGPSASARALEAIAGVEEVAQFCPEPLVAPAMQVGKVRRLCVCVCECYHAHQTHLLPPTLPFDTFDTLSHLNLHLTLFPKHYLTPPHHHHHHHHTHTHTFLSPPHAHTRMSTCSERGRCLQRVHGGILRPKRKVQSMRGRILLPWRDNLQKRVSSDNVRTKFRSNNGDMHR